MYYHLQNSVPKYRNKTLFKDVLENNPNLIDKTMPFDELNIYSDYADYLCDCLTEYYYFSEIAFYYTYEFEHYFKSEMKRSLPKYAPLLKSEVDTYINILKSTEKSVVEENLNSFEHGKKIEENNTNTKTESIEYGKTTETVTDNSVNDTSSETDTNSRNSTQYEQQLVNEDGTSENNSTRDSTQHGTYDVNYGGTDKKTNNDTETKNITNSGTDNVSENKQLSDTTTIRNIDAIIGASYAKNIVDEFIGKFNSLFMEVLNV